MVSHVFTVDDIEKNHANQLAPCTSWLQFALHWRRAFRGDDPTSIKLAEIIVSEDNYVCTWFI